jgi:hypothetical protein
VVEGVYDAAEEFVGYRAQLWTRPFHEYRLAVTPTVKTRFQAGRHPTDSSRAGLFRGFILRNSDVGAAVLTLDVFLFRAVGGCDLARKSVCSR